MRRVSRSRLAALFVSLADRYPVKKLVPVFAAELVRQGKEAELELFIKDVSRELLKQHHHASVTATFAHPLKQNVQDELKRALQKWIGAKTMDMTTHLNPALLGGAYIEGPDFTLDMTVRSQLEQLEA